jgi:hypothetical protein
MVPSVFQLWRVRLSLARDIRCRVEGCVVAGEERPFVDLYVTSVVDGSIVQHDDVAEQELDGTIALHPIPPVV